MTNFPEGQFEQVDEEEVEYFPEAQMVQELLPCSENVPASQSMQVSSDDPFAVLRNGGKTSVRVRVRDTIKYGATNLIFRSHLENFPASQEVHTEAPAGENFPELQFSQVVSEVAPIDVLNFPESQFEHAGKPDSLLYLPAEQSVHVLSDIAPTDSLYFPAEQL